MNANEVNSAIPMDNQAAPGLSVEHGFSLWIEDGKQRILFDTGQGRALMPTAKAQAAIDGLAPERRVWDRNPCSYPNASD